MARQSCALRTSPNPQAPSPFGRLAPFARPAGRPLQYEATADVYSHLTDDMLEEAAGKLGRRLLGDG